MEPINIIYKQGNDLDPEQVIDLYKTTSLGARRPVENRERMAAMVRNANLVITAWDGDRLVGIARSLTDWVYVTYLSDLAVHGDYQKQGIGKALIEETRQAAQPGCYIALLAAPQASDYYGPLGFDPHPRAWVLPARESE